MRGWFIAVLLLMRGVILAQEYLFEGIHFCASYSDCNLEALCDMAVLEKVMLEASEKSGANILGYNSHVFPPYGLTLVVLLSESHASIHTYPEHNACFVDLFTCGSNCSSEIFDQILREYLQPKTVDTKLFFRSEGIEER